MLSHSVMSDSLRRTIGMDYGPQGSFVHGASPGRNTGVGCQALLQGIFPTQGSNPGLQHCRQILYCLSHHRGPNGHNKHIQNIPPNRNGTHILLKCTWNTFQVRSYVRQLSKSQQIQDRVISSIFSDNNGMKLHQQ